MEIMIREMKENDWDAVATIYQEGLDTKLATFQTEVPSYAAWDASHIKDCRLVAEADHQVIGWTALTPYSSRQVYRGVAEVSIYIRKEFRKNQVGEKLLQALITEAESVGIWTLQSSIIEINSASIALHKKVGFRMVGHRERIARDVNGAWQNTILMERRSTVNGA